ncbi:MAG: molybdopterin-binding protein, partial [Pseudomonadota bacterium]
MQHTQEQAALLIIGDEILSGRTKDSNLQTLAKKLNARGIALAEARVVPDVMEKIITSLNELRQTYHYVFTTGGIGPTHDDITCAAIAGAFGVAIVEHPLAMTKLAKRYQEIGQEFTEARRKMACVPEGATLIDNPVSVAPGFHIGNVYCMAGVPDIMSAMCDLLIPTLAQGAIMLSKSLITNLPESDVAPGLAKIARNFPMVDIGSYPRYDPGNFRVSLVARSLD